MKLKFCNKAPGESSYQVELALIDHSEHVGRVTWLQAGVWAATSTRGRHLPMEFTTRREAGEWLAARWLETTDAAIG